MSDPDIPGWSIIRVEGHNPFAHSDDDIIEAEFGHDFLEVEIKNMGPTTKVRIPTAVLDAIRGTS